MNHKQGVLFFRDFRGFQGGHLKVWHYYQHLKYSNRFNPRIYFSKESVWSVDNPWFEERDDIEPRWEPGKADILFLGGMDWLMLAQTGELSARIPVINLIQGVRHARPDDPRFAFLKRKAIRICVSQEVTDALLETKRVNGPIFTITNGLDLDRLPEPQQPANRTIGIFVLGPKNPRLAQTLVDALEQRGISVEVQVRKESRDRVLDRLARCGTAIVLPSPVEGFYLPALEAMALGALVICPDCIGNRGFCWNGINCLMPEYRLDQILRSVEEASSMAVEARDRIIENGRRTAERHSLIFERSEFLNIMSNLESLW